MANFVRQMDIAADRELVRSLIAKHTDEWWARSAVISDQEGGACDFQFPSARFYTTVRVMKNLLDLLTNKARMISRRLGTCVPTIVLVLACTAVTSAAFARTVYDGDWSVLIVSFGRACAPTFRFGVQIADGMVISDRGSIVTTQGRVTKKGAVRVIVRAGSQWADGSGRLTRSRGGGVWKGQSTSGTCVGTWAAERR